AGANGLDVFRDGKPTKVQVNAPGRPHILAYTLLDDKQVVFATTDKRMHLADLKTGKIVRDYLQRGWMVRALAPSPVGPRGQHYFASVAEDHVVRIYDPAQPNPLLFLTASGRNWIVWTRGGYYAASPFGERLIGWQVNNGPDDVP